MVSTALAISARLTDFAHWTKVASPLAAADPAFVGQVAAGRAARTGLLKRLLDIK